MNKNKKILFAGIFLLLPHVAFSMQEAEKVKIFSPSEVVLNLVTSQYLPDHESVCSIGATSKYYNKLMLTTAENKKCQLMTCPERRYHFGNFVHKYGTASYWAYKRSDMGQLVLMYCQLNNGKPEVQGDAFSGFISPLPHNPFFNEKGGLCFYGYGTIGNYTKLCSVIRYDLDGKFFRCTMSAAGVRPSDNLEALNLDLFLEYPILLKAILNSTIINKRQKNSQIGTLLEEYLVFSLEGAVLPDNYAKRTIIPDMPAAFSYKSIEDFPYNVKNAIEKRYKECKEKR